MDFGVEAKADNSPLTIADKKSHEVIVSGLSKIFILPILSEEGKKLSYEERKQWGRFWLIDPLDGTKEFIKRNGEFTVNIALVEQKRVTLGVVYVPVQDCAYFGIIEKGAYKCEKCKDIISSASADKLSFENLINQSTKLMPTNDIKPGETMHVVASRSHLNDETKAFIDELKQQHGSVELVTAGSSLKLCLVAEGKAHVYPRIAPTMEWDTAAAHAVVKAAGKNVYQYGTKEELCYNKENLLNPYFVVQ
jgi:3'(2'), 5'-bisphosphate nucleotidase